MEFKTRFISREDRRIARQSLTGKHGFKASITIGQGDIPVALSDFSSLGFAISLPRKDGAVFAVGDVLQVRVSPLIHHDYTVKGVLIDKQPSRNDRIKLSAVIEHEQSCKHDQYHPIHLNSEQSIKGQLIHPFFYKQHAYFELESLSRNGFYATNINSDFTLFNNMALTFSLGSISGLQQARGVVSNVSLTADNRIRCFIETPYLPVQAEEEISQHCFHFAQKTPREIAAAGLKAEHIQEIVQYRFVETQAEYEAVLRLRRKTYASRGICAKDDPLAKFAMEQDAYGRILIVFHNARVIASALLVFGERGVKPFHMDSLLPASSLSKLPRYEEVMEITAICIEKHYQDTDVLHGVFENMYREGLSAGKRYVLVASEPEWVQRYARMGFTSTGLHFDHPDDPETRLSVMLLNKDTGKTGRGMNPITWWQVWGFVSLYLYRRRIIEYTPLQKLRVYMNRALFELNRGLQRLLRVFR